MKLSSSGYRVAVVGASSILGRELLDVFEERSFPVSQLIKYEADDEEPDLPIVDLRESSLAAVADHDVRPQHLDFAFLAARPAGASALPAFLCGNPGRAASSAGPTPGAELEAQTNTPEGPTRCVTIDLSETLAEASGRVLSVPFLERGGAREKIPGRSSESKLFVSPHPAAILISSLLLRLAARFTLERAVAVVFQPVSEIGPRAIEELQKQAVNILTFQKIPRAVFGDQLAFNLLPRLGRLPESALVGLEKRLSQELREYLSNHTPLPALRLFQVPVFHSLAVSLYVETAKPESCEAITQALAGEPLRVRRLSQAAPSQVEATGSGDILVDAIARDAGHSAGTWLWAVADNMRLAAVNAVEIAESLKEREKRLDERP